MAGASASLFDRPQFSAFRHKMFTSADHSNTSPSPTNEHQQISPSKSATKPDPSSVAVSETKSEPDVSIPPAPVIPHQSSKVVAADVSIHPNAKSVANGSTYNTSPDVSSTTAPPVPLPPVVSMPPPPPPPPPISGVRPHSKIPDGFPEVHPDILATGAEPEQGIQYMKKSIAELSGKHYNDWGCATI